MCKLIDQAHLRRTPQNRLYVHILKHSAAILYFAARNSLEAFRAGDGILPAVGFKIADDNIRAFALEFAALLQHLERLAHTGRINKINLEKPLRAGKYVFAHE